MTDTGTALVVIPKNELAIVAKQAGDKAARLRKAEIGCLIGGLSGAVMVLGGMAAFGAAPVVAPVLLGVGFVSLFGGAVTGMLLDNKTDKATARQNKAIAERTALLKERAWWTVMAAVENGTIQIGNLPVFAPEGETPKKVLVESMQAIIDSDARKRLGISARILEENGSDIDWLKGGLDRTSLEQSVTAFPKAVIESIRTETSRAGASSTTEPQPRWHPEPPTVRKPEKNLPRGPVTRSRGPT